MSVNVRQLKDTAISAFITSCCGHALSEREQGLFDYCQSLGEVRIGFVDDEFICCWGLIPPSFLSSQAYLWMWAPGPIKHQFQFIRQSQIQVQKMLEEYDTIVGHCKIESRSAQRWLRWLGAEFGYPQGGVVPFEIRRKTNG